MKTNEEEFKENCIRVCLYVQEEAEQWMANEDLEIKVRGEALMEIGNIIGRLVNR